MKPDQIFPAAQLEEQPLTRQGLAAFVSACCGDFQTALMEISDSGQRYILIMAHGQALNVYQIADLAVPLAVETWLDALSGGGQTFIVRTLALTPQTVRLVKVLVEQTGASRTLAVDSADLEALVAQAEQASQPSLLRFTWQNAQALALLPGAGRPPSHSLFIASNQIIHSAGSMAALYGWREPLIYLESYDSAFSSPAWEEYILHYAFMKIVGRLVSRFDQLAGPIAVNALLREINYAASANGWNISLTSAGVTDQAVFSSPRKAARVYQRMSEILTSHLKNSLGEALLNLLLAESQARLRLPYRQIVDKYLLLAVQNA